MVGCADVSIRAAVPADAAQLAALIQAAFAPYRDRLRPAPSALKETAESIGSRLTSEQGLAAEADGRIVGCIFLSGGERRELHVGRLAVLPGWQGRGVARRLMAAAEQIARQDGRQAMSLAVRAALTANVAVFERLGFRETGRRPHPVNPTTILMDMVKALAGEIMATPGKLSIRSAQMADAEGIAAVLRRAFAGYEGKLQPPAGALRETAETIRAKLARERALVVEAAAEIIACVFFKPAAEPATIYLGRLAVAPEHQGQGIARRLIEALEERARAEGAVALTLNVRIALPENRALFEHLGFHRSGDGRHPGFEQPTFAIMRKQLGL